MNESNKIIAKNTAFLYFRMLFVMLVSLFTSRFLLNRLGIENYGIFNVIAGLVVIFCFANVALLNATQRYITFCLAKDNIQLSNKVFNICLCLHFVIAIFVVLVGEVIGQYLIYNQMEIPQDKIDTAIFVLHFSLLTSLFSIVTVPFNSEIIAHEDMKFYSYISISAAIMKIGNIVLLYLFEDYLLEIFAILVFSNQFVVTLISILFCKMKYKEVFFRFQKDFILFKEIVFFSMWCLIGDLAWVLTTQGTNVLLNVFFGPTVNAARGIAVQVQTAIQNLSSNFSMALNPQITKNYSLKKMPRVHELFFISSKLSFFLVFLLSFPVFAETRFVLKTWLGIIPEHTIEFIRLTLIISLLYSIENPFTVTIFATGKVKSYQIVLGCFNLINMPVSYFILKYYKQEPEFVFIVVIVTIMISQYIRLLFLKRYAKINLLSFLKKIYFPCLLVVFVTYLLYIFIHNNFILFRDSLPNMALCCFLSSIFIFFIGLNRNERLFIVSLVVNIFFKICKIKNK